MTYIAADQSADGMAKVIYQSKDATSTKTFDARLRYPAKSADPKSVDAKKSGLGFYGYLRLTRLAELLIDS
jgi:hypothetical protein